MLAQERINRNIVECKDNGADNDSERASSVLIETLWNVKRLLMITVCTPHSCINRNIVECKVQKWVPKHSHIDVLIETLWNVKSQPI